MVVLTRNVTSLGSLLSADICRCCRNGKLGVNTWSGSAASLPRLQRTLCSSNLASGRKISGPCSVSLKSRNVNVLTQRPYFSASANLNGHNEKSKLNKKSEAPGSKVSEQHELTAQEHKLESAGRPNFGQNISGNRECEKYRGLKTEDVRKSTISADRVGEPVNLVMSSKGLFEKEKSRLERQRVKPVKPQKSLDGKKERSAHSEGLHRSKSNTSPTPLSDSKIGQSLSDVIECSGRAVEKALPADDSHIALSVRDIMDASNPALWYPKARALRRKIYLHIGPTNSGKTYQALQRFSKAKSGFYAGPLRLLAREIYQRMKTQGRPCNLVTGEEVITEIDPTTNEEALLSSGTVEMVDLKGELDIAVIDEIQMIDNVERGWAWTQALLGVRAREVHLCGDPSSERLIVQMAELCGDELEIIRYKRLSPLEVEPKHFDKVTGKLQAGDCFVAFSRRKLLQTKDDIERRTGERCAIVYGGLPAEVRSLQAQLFNDPNSGYKYLVASDAIGMGLNLAVRRVIFTTTTKFLGNKNKRKNLNMARIPVGQIKQLAGRAGRFQMQSGTEGKGFVTAMNQSDLKYVVKCLASDTPLNYKACVLPTDDQLRALSLRCGPLVPFHKLLAIVKKKATVGSRFFLGALDAAMDVSSIFADVQNLTFDDKLKLAKAPVNSRQPLVETAFKAMCEIVASGSIRTISEIPEVGVGHLSFAVETRRDFGDILEQVHKNINLFLWLSYRFPTNFLDRQGAMEMRDICEARISAILASRSARPVNS